MGRDEENDKTILGDISRQEFWAARLAEISGESILSSSQQANPRSWLNFYDNVSDIWMEMQGSVLDLGRKLLDVLEANTVIHPGDRILDIGCGPGNLTIPFAEAGFKVTALDNSEMMLAEVSGNAELWELSDDISPVLASFENYSPEEKHDLTVAAFFPPVFLPAGIEKMESMSDGHCCIILSDSPDPLPFRKVLWKELMTSPLPERKPLLVSLLNFLISSGRKPELFRISRQVELDTSSLRLIRYYREYFSIFTALDPDKEKLLESTLESFAEEGRIGYKSQADYVLLCWNAGVKKSHS